MNSANYFIWAKEKLIPNLPEKLVVIIGNALHHDVEIDKAPSSNTRRQHCEVAV
jgi:hypothetical protein